jgi:hypothetical protein
MKPVFDPWLVIVVSYLGSQSLRPPSPTTFKSNLFVTARFINIK